MTSKSLSTYCGEQPPELDRGEIRTVCYRICRDERTGTCHTTGKTLDLTKRHLYVTVRASNPGNQPEDFTHYIFTDQDALDQWVAGNRV